MGFQITFFTKPAIPNQCVFQPVVGETNQGNVDQKKKQMGNSPKNKIGGVGGLT